MNRGREYELSNYLELVLSIIYNIYIYTTLYYIYIYTYIYMICGIHLPSGLGMTCFMADPDRVPRMGPKKTSGPRAERERRCAEAWAFHTADGWNPVNHCGVDE